MTAIVPDEGNTLRGNLLLINADVDRGTDLQIGLFTNPAADETITEATITEPTGTGYARITLTDANWVEGAGSVFSYAQQVFIGGVGGWTGSIYGYFIATNGTTPRIISLEIHDSGPHTIIESQNYFITPNLSFIKCP